MTYSIQLPDGTLVENIPDELDPQEAKRQIIARRPELGGKKAPKAGLANEFGRGFDQLLNDTATAIGSVGTQEQANRAAAEGVAGGKKIAAERGEDPLSGVYRKYNEPGGGFAPAAAEFVRSMPRALAGQAPNLAAMAGGARIGAGLGSLVAPGLGTVVGGALGAGAAIAPQMFGQNVQTQSEENPQGDVDRGSAALAAAGQTALEVGGGALVVGKRLVSKILGVAPEVIAKQSAKAGAKMAVEAERSLAAAAGRGAAKGVMVEMPVEVAQQVMQRAQAGLSLTDDDAMSEYGQSALGALQVAPALGALGGSSERSGARQHVAAADAAVRAEEAQKAAVAAEQQRVQKEAQLKDPAYLAQTKDAYTTAEAKWRSMMGVKPGKDASPADVEMYKAQQASAKEFFNAEVKPAMEAYNEARIAQPEAAQAAPVTPTPPADPAAPQDELLSADNQGEAQPWKDLTGQVTSPLDFAKTPPAADPLETFMVAEQQVRGLSDLKERARADVANAAKAGDAAALSRATRQFRQAEQALTTAEQEFGKLPKPPAPATAAQLQKAQAALDKAAEAGDVDAIEKAFAKVQQLKANGTTQEEALTPANMMAVEEADNRVAEEIASGREQEAARRGAIDAERESLQGIGDRARQGLSLNYPLERRRVELDKRAPMDTGETQQQTLFDTPGTPEVRAQTGAGGVSQKTRAELQAELTIARASGNKAAATAAVESLRDLNARNKESPDNTSAMPTGAAQVARDLAGTKMPSSVARRQAASDARAMSYAKLVDTLNRFNKGRAKRDELNTAYAGVLSNVIAEIEAATGKPMHPVDRKQVTTEVRRQLDELVGRFGDTRDVASVGSRESPRHSPVQHPSGQFIRDMEEGANVESQPAGARTFGSPFAAAQSIAEGIANIRNAAINDQPLPGTNMERTRPSPGTTVEELQTAVAAARDSDVTPQADQELVARLGLGTGSDPDTRALAARWLQRVATGNSSPEMAAELTQALDALEQGKRSETETVKGKVKRAVQGEMFPDPVQGDIFKTRAEFETYMASGALNELRKAMGMARATASRVFKRTAPLRARIKELQQDAANMRKLLATQIEVRDDARAQAKTKLDAAERALAMKVKRLDAEMRPQQAAYLEAKMAVDFALETSRDISEKIAHNVLAFGGAPGMVEAAQRVYTAKQAYADAIKARSGEKLDFPEMLRMSKDVISALQAHAKALDKVANVDKHAKNFLQQDLNLQMQLADEVQNLSDVQPFLNEAKTDLDRINAEQQARPDVRAAKTRVVNAQRVADRVEPEGARDIGAANRAIDDIETELKNITKRVQDAMDEAGPVQMDRTAVRDAQTAQDDAQGRARVKSGQEQLERLASIPGRKVDFERRRKALQTLEDAPEKIATADAVANNADVPVTTRHKAKRTADALRRQTMLTAGMLSEDPETVIETLQALNIRLEQLIAKRDHQRKALNEDGLSASTRKSRAKELYKTQVEAATMQRLANGFTGRPKVTELLTPDEQRTQREEDDILDTLNTALLQDMGGKVEALPIRRRGPLIRKATNPGSQRTGDLETQEQRRTSAKNPPQQTGTVPTPTAKQAVTQANKDAAALRPEAPSAAAKRDRAHQDALRDVEMLTAEVEQFENQFQAREDEAALPNFRKEKQETLRRLQNQIDTANEKLEAAQERVEATRPPALANVFSDRASTYITDTAALEAIDAGDTDAVMSHLAKNGSTPLVRALAARLQPLVGNTKLQVQSNLLHNGKPVAALYIPSTNTVLVDPQARTDEDILHEMTHAATQQVLEAPASSLTAEQRTAVAGLRNLFQSLKANPNFEGEYGMENLTEFVAEVYSNPVLQAKLNAIGKPQTIWQRFTALVKRVLGMNGDGPLDGALRNIDRVLTPSGEFKAAPVASAARVDTTSAIGVLATRHIAKPPSVRDLFKNNLGLAFETAVVDMRAAPIKALYAGAKNIAQQTAYFIRKADARMAHVYAALTEGPMQLVKDAKGNRMIEAGGGPSAKKLFEAVGRVPGLSDKDRANTVQIYLTAQRAKRVGVQALDLGKTTQAELDAVNQHVDANPALKTALEDVRSIYNAYNKGLIDFLADTGALPKAEAARLLAHGDYVPFYRVQSNGIAQLVFDESNVVNIGNLRYQPYLQALKADDAQLLPFNEAVVRNTMLLTDMGMRNMASKETAYAMQQLGAIPGSKNPMRIQKGDGPADVHAIRFNSEPDPAVKGDNGRRYLVVNTEGTVAESIPSEMIARGMEGSHVTLPRFLKIAGWFGDVLRSGVTRNPAYIARQLFRDPFAAALTGGLESGPLMGMAKSMSAFASQSINGPSATAQALIRKGVVQSGIFTGDPDDMAKFSLQLAGGHQGAINRLFAMADRAAMRSDSVTREQVYEDTLKRGGSEFEAEMAAIEMMNFHKRGLSPSVQYASRLIPFFNAQIQGLNVLYKAATGKMSAEARLGIQEKFFNRAMIMTAMTLAYASAMEDDETYKEAKSRDRYGNWFVPLGDGVTLKLPIPFEIGVLFKALPEMAIDVMNGTFGDTERKAFKDLLLNQIPGASGYFMPQAVKPFIEVALNRNTFTDRDIETQSMQRVDSTERFTLRTTEAAKEMSKALQGVLSPVQIEHLTRGYLGSLPMIVAALTNELFNPHVETPMRRLSESPMAGVFFQERLGGGATEALYAKIKASSEAAATIKKMEAEGRKADAAAYRENVLGVLQVDLKSASSKLQALAKREKAARLGTASAERKREVLDGIDREREALSRRYLDAIEQVAK